MIGLHGLTIDVDKKINKTIIQPCLLVP